MLYALKKAEILRGKHSFDNVFKHGRVIETTYVRGLLSIMSKSSDTPKSIIVVGFATQRGLLNAVERNRLKRLMRESYRLNKNMLLRSVEMSQRNANLVFMYAPKIEVSFNAITFASIENDLKTILSIM